MTMLHEPQRTGPARSSHRDLTRWLLAVVSVVVVVGVVSVTLALLIRGDGWERPTRSSTIPGSGVATSETRTLPPFTAVELAGSNNLTVQVGSPQSVAVRGDDNLVGHVRTTVRSGVLVIETVGDFSTRAPMRVSVVAPDLTSVSLSGSGTVTVDGVVAASFTAGLSGSGTMLVTGRAERLDASLAGSGQMDLHGLVARTVAAQLPGSGEIEVYAVDSLDADVSGTGSVIYAGDPPQVTSTVTGTGAVEPE